MTNKNDSVGNFIDGQRDCRDGVESKKDMPQPYYDGYGTQYALEATQTALAEQRIAS